MRKKNNLVIILSIAFVLSVIWVGNVYRNNLTKTLEPSQIIGPIYQGEEGSSDLFCIEYNFENSGNFPIKITQLGTRVLINGTDYNNQQMTHGLASIEPDSQSNIIRIVQLSNTPIHNVEGQIWNITAITEIKGESHFFTFTISNSKLLTTSVNWKLSTG
jgi:hypothetical protein